MFGKGSPGAVGAPAGTHAIPAGRGRGSGGGAARSAGILDAGEGDFHEFAGTLPKKLGERAERGRRTGGNAGRGAAAGSRRAARRSPVEAVPNLDLPATGNDTALEAPANFRSRPARTGRRPVGSGAVGFRSRAGEALSAAGGTTFPKSGADEGRSGQESAPIRSVRESWAIPALSEAARRKAAPERAGEPSWWSVSNGRSPTPGPRLPKLRSALSSRARRWPTSWRK